MYVEVYIYIYLEENVSTYLNGWGSLYAAYPI